MKKILKNKFSSGSRKWLEQHFSDHYVQQARRTKVRSRAWFKLDQINRVDCLFRLGMTVVDFGSTHGAWSKYAKEKIGKNGYVIACDILPMDKIKGVDFLQGDCSDPFILQKLIRMLYSKKADVVLSDMCANISGIVDVDVSRSIYFGELVLNICEYILMCGGSFLVKVFQGAGFEEYFKYVSSLFNIVKIRKPIASHIHSREVYIVAKGYNM